MYKTPNDDKSNKRSHILTHIEASKHIFVPKEKIFKLLWLLLKLKQNWKWVLMIKN